MIIGNIRRATVHDRPALVADVVWEAGAARTQPLYFATDSATADALCLGAAPFLVACCLPAAHAGEARLSVEGEACPVLLDGVRTNLDYYERWYGGYGAMAVECEPFTASAPAAGMAGMMFSGGMDSLFTLRRNHTLYGRGHPRSIKRLIFIDYYGHYGHDADDQRGFTAEALGEYEAQSRRIQDLCQASGLDLVRVFTNVTSLNEDKRFWTDHFHGAALAACAHALAQGMASVTFASTDMPLMRPYGSHPLTDPGWSSQGLRIHHDSMRFSRLEKTAAIAAWPEALRGLRVCTSRTYGGQNCGRCEKCRRTMLMLLALGHLEEAPFPRRTLAPADLATIQLSHAFQVQQYASLVPALRASGHADLAQAIEEKIRRHHHPGIRARLRRWRRALGLSRPAAKGSPPTGARA